jgi:hypothetical protein
MLRNCCGLVLLISILLEYRSTIAIVLIVLASLIVVCLIGAAIFWVFIRPRLKLRSEEEQLNYTTTFGEDAAELRGKNKICFVLLLLLLLWLNTRVRQSTTITIRRHSKRRCQNIVRVVDNVE